MIRILLICALSCAPALAQSPHCETIMRAYSVRVFCEITLSDGSGDGWGLGSGVIVCSEGGPLVVTASHVVHDRTGKVWYQIGDTKKYTSVLTEDPVMDLAVLDARAEINGGAQPTKFIPGAVYYLAGFKQDGVYHIHRLKHVSCLGYSGRPWKWPLCTGEAHQGDSGGGVFDENGSVIGIVWGAPPGQSAVTAGIPFRNIIDKARKARTP